MGIYNPRNPQNIGQEWVPIRDEDLVLNPFANTIERGYSFRLPTSTTVDNVHFYLKQWPNEFGSNMVYTASIYPNGQEAASGPVRSVIIPCNYAEVTGSAIIQTFPGLTTAQNLFANGDNYFLFWTMGQANPEEWGLSTFFAVNSYAPLLNGKRILGVDLLAGINVLNQGFSIEESFQSVRVDVATDFGYTPLSYDTMRLPDLITNRTPESTKETVRMHMGDANRFFGVGSGTSAGINQIMPWTFSELARFEAGAVNRLRVRFGESGVSAALGPQFQFEYCALEVFYCEESRVAMGSKIFNDDIPNRPSRDPFVLGANSITVRNPLTAATGPILPNGDYTVTISESNLGDNYYANLYRTVAQLNEVRQLYELPSHPGVQINLPFPLNENTIGSEFTSQSTDLIPQLTMHTSTGALIEYSHVYGQQSAAQVYSTNTASQEVDDRFVGAARQWPWVRYYARRFGKTTIPLRLDSASPTVSGSAFAVQITPTEFDALPEITDGWKEITLRFPTPPTMGTGSVPTWRWSATNETAGNRWEVLGATAPAVSGIVQDVNTNFWLPFAQVPTPQRLYLGTYGYPVSGAAINEDWLPQWGPYVSGTTFDNASDAVIIFSQYIPPITGFGVITASQAITGIGQNCGIDPCGIPTDILYNRLFWSPPVNTGSAWDDFTRTVSNSLGTSSSGGTYSTTGAATQYAVNGTQAVFTPDTTAVQAIGTLPIGPNFDVTVKFSLNGILNASSSARVGVVGRFTDSNNFYDATITTIAGSITSVSVRKVVAGVTTILDSLSPAAPSFDYGNMVNIRFMGSGPFLKAKVWSDHVDEPTMWLLEFTDTSLTTGNGAGIAASVTTNSLGLSVLFDDLRITPPQFWFGSYELQRSDEITDWQTIMLATNPAVTGFNDYEARTGMISNYRIRTLDHYDFPSDWSNTVSISLASPGVSGSCLSQAHVMIFTTNEHQSGYSNLAYSNAWEGQVNEDFAFAEAGFTQLQPMYDRDFFTAFRPRERGGDQFGRTLLVQAAAIDPATLPGFKALSDMAWADVSYICVRDEDGNRWFASINVPSGVVQNRRQLYMATVQIVEVTDTPSPVDPTWP
jgi:hypothetical protein